MALKKILGLRCLVKRAPGVRSSVSFADQRICLTTGAVFPVYWWDNEFDCMIYHFLIIVLKHVYRCITKYTYLYGLTVFR